MIDVIERIRNHMSTIQMKNDLISYPDVAHFLSVQRMNIVFGWYLYCLSQSHVKCFPYSLYVMYHCVLGVPRYCLLLCASLSSEPNVPSGTMK